jgi:N-acetylglucosamine-6-sulfatase
VHQPRSALGALCLVVAVAAAACSTATGAPRGDTGPGASTAGRSPDRSSAGPSGSGSAEPGPPQPARRPLGVPPRLRAQPVPTPPLVDQSDQEWQLGPQWAVEPELLQGSRRFRQLTHKGSPEPGEPTNVVLITTDDMRAGDLRWMPKTRALVGRAGTSFTDAISPHPLCCPARAELLTGQFAHNNGVRSNHYPSGGYYAFDPSRALPVWLQAAGYRTMFTGKYLNQYGKFGDPREIPPGWTRWVAAAARISDYFSYVLNDNGVLSQRTGTSQTELYADLNERAIYRMARGDKPFFIWQSHLAPHTACPDYTHWGDGGPCWQPPTPDPQYEGSYEHLRFPTGRDPSYEERSVADKPVDIRERPLAPPSRRRQQEELFQRRVESLQSVDDAVARTVDALSEAGVLDETLVIFTSDNGYLLGEHRYVGKNLPYEPALRVPLLMRGPSVPAGVEREATTGTLDLAPTIAAATGAEAQLTMDGRNLLPVARGARPGWETVLIQAGPRKVEEEPFWYWRGVRTDRYTFVEYLRTGEVELYDRRRDPFQLHNVAGDPAYSAVEAELRSRYHALEECAGQQCRQTFGPVPAPSLARAGG